MDRLKKKRQKGTNSIDDIDNELATPHVWEVFFVTKSLYHIQKTSELYATMSELTLISVAQKVLGNNSFLAAETIFQMALNRFEYFALTFFLFNKKKGGGCSKKFNFFFFVFCKIANIKIQKKKVDRFNERGCIQSVYVDARIGLRSEMDMGEIQQEFDKSPQHTNNKILLQWLTDDLTGSFFVRLRWQHSDTEYSAIRQTTVDPHAISAANASQASLLDSVAENKHEQDDNDDDNDNEDTQTNGSETANDTETETDDVEVRISAETDNEVETPTTTTSPMASVTFATPKTTRQHDLSSNASENLSTGSDIDHELSGKKSLTITTIAATFSSASALIISPTASTHTTTSLRGVAHLSFDPNALAAFVKQKLSPGLLTKCGLAWTPANWRNQ
ncbi:hypothetical protein RFI_36579 [Reticulomyxa filosa]|uniref:Uncharacterized protein n=1 Tax=Reticulomyxa filosa TaxID=46433 RepID=X6LH12_RETFI|nr:hypothetical protein RFI_36579 [Reticulomyxa filosa]|eukprot:ETO00859.1 hypothetical protein RFI_36579 [Reticulomyxa filosa]